MALRANAKEAFVSLYASKQRSLLALIGIVIGIGSVIGMVSVGEIAKRQALQQFKELGTEFLAISARGAGPSGAGVPPRFRLSDALALPDEVSSISASAPWTQGHAEALYNGKKIADATVLGVTESFTILNKLRIELGRGVSDLDYRRYYCVLGARVASALRRAGVQRPVGESIRLKDRLCTVMGVLRNSPRWGLQAFDANRSILVPISTAQRMFTGRGIRRITARMNTGAQHNAATEDVRSYFRRKAPGLGIRVRSAQRVIEQMQRQMQTFALLLAAIGSISLIVGGIGVMNVMLVSVSERRKEIGIRRALGARRFDIQSQFLTESLILSLIGGVFGIGIGVGGTWVFCRFTDWTFLVDPAAVAMGFVVACGIGVFFGLQPAVQASRLDPIEALRSG
ncbi:MAG: ABC transporter permease [Rhodospirillaceae bacterium]|nr:ABC transporter permease [Rhodospirillaceae bacterium]